VVIFPHNPAKKLFMPSRYFIISRGIPMNGMNTAAAPSTQPGTPESRFLIQLNAAKNAPVILFQRFTKKADTASQCFTSI
jgi:hypothetical protein